VIPTIAEEDARRPNRERQNLVTEHTRLVNQNSRALGVSRKKMAEPPAPDRCIDR
jgi:hypothetical protein